MATQLGDVVTGAAFGLSSSWTEQQIRRGEELIADAVHSSTHRDMVHQHAIDLACALIWALPWHVPLPAVVIEEDGEIALDWNESADRVLSVNVGANGYIGYAALIGLRPDYGRAPSFGSIPNTLLFHLLRLYPPPTSAAAG
jgi:hypothetical protein